MSYLVLARKHRPQHFDDLIGQEHITEILKKSIASKRIAHAYLFCGPRGIGKTSCARILAKCLNWEHGPSVDFDDEKSAICREITKGTSLDVMEIDGASNRGIDEIRTIRENVKFAPSYGRFKIYIVDEVHMLTTEAFNALLKTLEEPPDHVKFIFATTDPNKLPPTIISRCQRFDFKRISLKVITDVINEVSVKEKFNIDADAAFAIAKAAKGSLRDALSILDQLSALSDEGIHSEDVFSMLGLVETELLFAIVDAIGQKDCAAALKALQDIVEKGKDAKQLSKDLIEHFRHMMVIKVGGKSMGKLVDYPIAIKEMILKQCELFSLAAILNAIDTLIQAQETARITESVRMPLEVAFAKLTYRGEGIRRVAEPEQKTEAKSSGGGVRFSSSILQNEKGQVDISGFQEKSDDLPAPLEETEISDGVEEEPVDIGYDEEPGNGVNVDLEKICRSWDTLTHAVSKERMSLATYLQEGFPVEYKSPLLVVGFPKACTFHKEAVEDNQNVQLVERIFTDALRTPVRIEYRIVNHDNNPTTSPAKEEEPFVKSVLNTFKGKVINQWHNE